MFHCKPTASAFPKECSTESLQRAAVSVPFHQTMRSTCPAFTILIYRLYYSRAYSTATYLSLVPIVFGVALATYGDYYFTLTGFLLTLSGVILAAAKVMGDSWLGSQCQWLTARPDRRFESPNDRETSLASLGDLITHVSTCRSAGSCVRTHDGRVQ